MSYPPPGPPGPPGYPAQPPYAAGPPGPPPPHGPPHGQPPPPYPGGPPGYQPGPPYGAPPGCSPPAGYPGAPGYPPPGQGYPAPPPGQAYPSAPPPGYPPVGGYPPGAGAGYPPGAGAGYPPGAGAGYPPGAGYPQSMGRDSCDSDPEFGGLRSVDNDSRFRVKFINNSGRDVFLFWVNFKGSFEKFCKIKRGGHEEIDTFKNHVWMAMKKKKKRPFLVNKNWVYFASAENTTINIERPPRGRKNRRSGVATSHGGRPVVVKFINRTRRNAYIHTTHDQGRPSITKVLSPGKCWSVNSFEGQTWNVSDDKDRSKNLLLNYGWFYCAVRTRKMKERVVISDNYWMGSSSSSSSSSSSD